MAVSMFSLPYATTSYSQGPYPGPGYYPQPTPPVNYAPLPPTVWGKPITVNSPPPINIPINTKSFSSWQPTVVPQKSLADMLKELNASIAAKTTTGLPAVGPVAPTPMPGVAVNMPAQASKTPVTTVKAK